VKSSIQPPRLHIKNMTSAVIEVMVEVYPDRYLLRPNEEMQIEPDPTGAPFEIHLHEGGPNIFPGSTAGALVTIDGVQVEPN